DWLWRPLFLGIERDKMGGVSLWDKGADFAPSTMETGREKSLTPNRTLKPLDLSQLTSLLGEDGLLSQAFAAFEYRPGQVSMMQAVAEALNNGQHLIVEAGTGIGKSIAYLLPAIYFALENSTHIIISTNTINLQEQLINKDIPDLLRALGITQNHSSDLKVAQLKGRNNYLCLRRWNFWRKTPGLPWGEVKFLLRLLVWLSSTSTGDRAELNLSGGVAYLWSRICASEDNCVVERCPYYPTSCFLYRARQKTEVAHLIVTNHALLLTDLAKSRGILPECSYLVIDEAHHLEREATEQLGYQITEQDVGDYLDRFGDRGGFGFHLQNYLRTASIVSLRRREIEQRVEGLREQAKTARASTSQLFDLLTYFLYLQAEEQGEYERHLRFTREVHAHPRWSEVELSWENLNLQLGGIEAGLSELYTMLEDLPDRSGSELNSSLSELSSMRQRVWGLRHQINPIIATPEEQNIYWASLKGQDDTLCLHAAPLRVGQALEKWLFAQKDCVMLTSATLSTEGNFEYIKESLGLKEAKELKVDAPFDYMASTMIYLPQDIPEPGKADYQQKVEQSLIELCRVTRGRTLVLFTSHAALRATYNAIQAPLEEEGILVLGQGINGSPKRLLDTFRANQSLLLGTASLWEGVDVVGKALSVLVIARLPFSVPTDPVFSARSELFEDPFNQYTLPQVVLKFKQGFGRLIRSRYDRGVMIVLDSRLQTKPYGRVFLQSLPRCTVRSGRLRQMPQEVVGWLGD
ncbi:MAG TPA: helicase C-terminal domain-containing protein, partial [Dehalococcoidia bacterium]|nr:helicase C-terminal domain-containing protein [Dehalococcoidia bacterium]